MPQGQAFGMVIPTLDDTHPLDRPVWQALTTRQAALAHGDARALRFDADFSPFGAAADTTPESLAALVGLIPAGGTVWMVEDAGFPVPPGAAVVRAASCHQMVADTVTAATSDIGEIIVLGDADAAEMRALVQLTEPGPFMPRTHRMGRFIGIRDHGRLVAMAGERLQPPGCTEVSGVCTHPDYRGHGLAGGLMRQVATRILARGETPILHAYAGNTRALALYATLGFRLRRALTMTVLAHR